MAAGFMSATTLQSKAPGGACEAPEISGCCGAGVPVLALFAGAACWLVVAAVLALIASLKFHLPSFLASCPAMTYGRVHAAHFSVLAYGFAAPAAIGVTLWLLAKTGQTRLALPGGAFIATLLWNLGVLVGVGSILAGGATGFELFDFSQAGSTMLLLAYLVLALAGGLTFANRTERGNDAVQWFLLAALLWFPWIYTTAAGLLGCAPVRGVAQAAIAWWFANNFTFVWMGLIGIGTLFYFAAQFAGRPLHSRQLALFAFWVLVLFGSWAGIPDSAPLPAWLPALSAMGAFLSLVVMLAVAINLKKTVGQCLTRRPEPAAKFLGVGALALNFFILVRAVTSFTCISQITDLTWVGPALTQLWLYGFMMMVLSGAIYYIVPQLAGKEFCSPRAIKFQFWTMLAGMVLLVLPLLIGGVVQGEQWQNPNVATMDAVQATLPFLRVSTMGDLFILLGSVTLLLNLGGFFWKCCRACCAGSCAASSRTAGVRA